MSWQFWEYVTTGGEGAVSEWVHDLGSIGEDAKAVLDARVQIMQPMGSPIPRKYFAKLTNKHGEDGRGLYEIRFTAANGTVQFRPLCCCRPSYKIVILIGATEKDNRLLPHGICQRAHNRVAELGQRERSRPYELG
jgi:hypothetical protein